MHSFSWLSPQNCGSRSACRAWHIHAQNTCVASMGSGMVRSVHATCSRAFVASRSRAIVAGSRGMHGDSGSMFEYGTIFRQQHVQKLHAPPLSVSDALLHRPTRSFSFQGRTSACQHVPEGHSSARTGQQRAVVTGRDRFQWAHRTIVQHV